MFLGEYEHSLDAKGRVILPARFRDALKEGAVIAKGLDGCLAVYPAEEFRAVGESVREQMRQGPEHRQAGRAFFAGATEVKPDNQGRVAIPAGLRTFAGLERDVVVSGQLHIVEIWDAGRWREAGRVGDASILAGSEIPTFGM